MVSHEFFQLIVIPWKNSPQNESIDGILSVEKDHVFKKPQMLLHIIFILKWKR